VKQYLFVMLVVVFLHLSANTVAADRQLAGEFIDIPEGIFLMGDSSGEGGDDEKPPHQVKIKPFRLAKHEVTFVQWDFCVEDGGCNNYRPDDEGWGRGEHPVINVSWDDIQIYLAWLNKKTGRNYRLPSEAEWEYAARAGTTMAYPWGFRASHDYANYGKDDLRDKQAIGHERWGKPQPVGQLHANNFGLYDMHGNVWEWTDDCWHPTYENAPRNSVSWTISGNCSLRVSRGGSFNNRPRNVRSAARTWNNSSFRYNNLGFRLAHDITSTKK